MTIKKAIFPVAGLGSRFLPATKSIPKEMLPVIDKPLIQYATDEALQAGLDTLIFINGKNKRAIEDYFDRDTELESRLKDSGKNRILEELSSIAPKKASFIYLRQYKPLGLGHAVMCAQPVIDNQAFAVLLADDFIAPSGNINILQNLIRIHEQYNCCVLTLIEVPEDHVERYGVIDGKELEEGLFEVKNLIEKPKREEAPSRFAVMGRYILVPKILELLQKTKSGAGGEIQLTDALKEYVRSGGRIMAYHFKGAHYDCGSKEGYFAANMHVASTHPEINLAELIAHQSQNKSQQK